MVDERHSDGLRERLRDELRVAINNAYKAAVAALRAGTQRHRQRRSRGPVRCARGRAGTHCGRSRRPRRREVARRQLSDRELVEMLRDEVVRWESTARECERVRRSDDAARLRAEIACTASIPHRALAAGAHTDLPDLEPTPETLDREQSHRVSGVRRLPARTRPCSVFFVGPGARRGLQSSKVVTIGVAAAITYLNGAEDCRPGGRLHLAGCPNLACAPFTRTRRGLGERRGYAPDTCGDVHRRVAPTLLHRDTATHFLGWRERRPGWSTATAVCSHVRCGRVGPAHVGLAPFVAPVFASVALAGVPRVHRVRPVRSISVG